MSFAEISDLFCLFEISTSFEFSGNTIETALLSIPRYLFAAFFTSEAVTFLILSI